MVAWQYVLTVIAVVVALYMFFKSKFDPNAIRGKRILITGASSGIGEHIAYQYSKLGASIMITARREGHLQKVAAACKQLGAKQIEYVAADMSLAEDREKVVSELEKRLGGLDHLILNHALFTFERCEYDAAHLAALQANMEINFFSFAHITTKCMKMLKESHGSIGVVSSVAGKFSGALSTYYSTSKYALDGYFSAIREELSIYNEKVSVTLFVLGYIKTEMAVDISQNIFTGIAPPAAEVDDTAEVIMKGVATRQYEVHYPSYIWHVLAFARLFPRVMNRVLNMGVKTALLKRNLL